MLPLGAIRRPSADYVRGSLSGSPTSLLNVGTSPALRCAVSPANAVSPASSGLGGRTPAPMVLDASPRPPVPMDLSGAFFATQTPVKNETMDPSLFATPQRRQVRALPPRPPAHALPTTYPAAAVLSKRVSGETMVSEVAGLSATVPSAQACKQTQGASELDSHAGSEMDWLWGALPSGLTGGSESSSSSSRVADKQRQKWLDMQGPPRSGGETPDDTGGLEAGNVGREGVRQQLLPSPGRPVGRPGARGAPSSGRELQEGPPTDLALSPGQQGRRRHALHSWEVESDDSAEVASEGERAATRWSPFMNREETEQADYAENRMREQLEPDGPDELGRLEAYEEHALGLRPMAKKAVTKASGASRASATAKPDDMAAIADESVVESEEEEVDQGQVIRNNKERAKREGLAFFEVPGDGNWNHHGGKWMGSGLGGAFSVDQNSRGVSYAYYDEMLFKDFDVEAEFNVSDGDHVGLLFHFVEASPQHPHHHYYALCVNLLRQQAELRSTHDPVALAPVNIQRQTWFQLRVRAAGSTLMLFVDHRQVGQQVFYHEKDRVVLRDTGEEVLVKTNYGDGTYEIDLKEGQRVAGRQLGSLSGRLGIWSLRTVATIKNIVVINLEDMVLDMCLHDQRMIDEAEVMKEKAKAMRKTMLRKTKAAQLIQEISKLNLSIMHQRMQMYEQAVRQGRDDQMRHRKLLVWFALFSVFQKFNEVMATPEKKDRRQVLYLEWLDAKDPPPPAPPLKEPPRASDEELHYRYEERRHKYADRWEKAGKMVVGQERFEEIVNMESGPAEREKRLIAQACFQKATEVMSEQEHQEFLGKAWRLENDWTSTDDGAAVAEEIERWRDEKMRVTAPKEKSKSRSRLNLT